ncbi:hypothetical protein EC991_001252 [Linnemannia zychae]|nr:hypothetical protein EC991_001252 [Linnemannia zychae]
MTTPTLSQAPSSSTSHPKQRRTTTTRAAILLITLTLACCLLATSSSTCLAAPVGAGASKSLRQRSLAHQVHHVQVADESVHNTVVLLKKSIQKRKSQNKRQQQPQQQQKAAEASEVKKTKRHGKRDIVDSVPENRNNNARYTASTLSASSLEGGSNNVKVDDASADLVFDNIATSTDARSSGSIPSDHATIHPTYDNSNKRKQLQKKKHQASTTRLLSAYESIVFSESQIPVFLTQDRHHHQQRKQRTLGLRVQQKGYVRISNGANSASQESNDAETERDNNNAQRHHQNPIRADTTDGDDVAVAQADDAHLSASSSPASSVLNSEPEYSVTQDAISSNDNLQNDHVDDQSDVVGVTFSEDDKNSPSFESPLHTPAATPVVVQVEQDEEELEAGELSAEPTQLETVDFEIDEEGAVEGSPAAEEAAVKEEEEEEPVTEDEDGWVTITNADLVSNNEDDIVSSIDSNPLSDVEFQSPESDDSPFIPFSSSSNNNDNSKNHHPTAAVATNSSLFHNGCSPSSTIVSFGLLLTVIGLAYRFYIHKQRQQQNRRLALPLDTKTAPILPSTLSSSSKSVHRLSVDSLSSPTTRDGARTTAMRDYVGFNVQ